MQELKLCAKQAYKRLDKFLAEAEPSHSRSFYQNLLEKGTVLKNGKIASASDALRAGDEVLVRIPDAEQISLEPENLPLCIVYEDADIAVIDKPKGMVVHPAPGNERGTLVNAILYHIRDLSGINGEIRPGIVHRIDKDTTGLLVIAKNDAAHQSLAEQIAKKEAARIYTALCYGNFREESGQVSAPIARHKSDRKKMAVVPGGREAISDWRVLERFMEYTLLEVSLQTGRTHQIRVHMAHIGHPIVGDPVY
ncbi:MAG: RluA family pseudouridine synthase, partial [Clostridiales bacterium]|nr:RluA family pseudouridine synthase [Clostridiales bacterium]